MPRFHELEDLEQLIAEAGDLIRAEVLCEVTTGRGRRFPVIGLAMGNPDPRVPVFGLFGGVHGLERIGSHTVLSYLTTLVETLRWDEHARARLERCRLVSIPIVNPGGMFQLRRANPRGVDLMRNAPIDAVVPPLGPFGGHRISPKLPWFRGELGAPMEEEAQALWSFVQRHVFPARAAMTLDVHSGFGARDRLWFPYAKGGDDFPRTREAWALAALLDRTYPNHEYIVEPQSASYTVHGDLWDYFFDQHFASVGRDGPVFLPWTLELGSWNWVRKNPRQLLSSLGPFNPILPHRLRRVLGQHLPLIDLLYRATDNIGSLEPTTSRRWQHRAASLAQPRAAPIHPSVPPLD